MKNISRLLVITLVSIFASLAIGCGGGKSDDKKDGGGINIDDVSGGNARSEIQGSWGSPCILLDDGSTAVLLYTFGESDNGTQLYAESYGFYKSGNCNGTPGTLSLMGLLIIKGHLLPLFV